jgi:hypothetical protein
MHLKIYLKLFLRRSFFCGAAEGIFGGGNLRDPNIQPIATTLIY